MSPEQTIATGLAVAQVAAPFLPPNAALALKLALSALSAVQAAQNDGRDVTPAELSALYDDYSAAQAEDDAAIAAAKG